MIQLGKRGLIAAFILLFVSSLNCKQNKSADQLRKEVIEKEISFKKLVDYFTSVTPDSNYIVTFGIGSHDRVHLIYYLKQRNINKNQYGGNNLELHSPELDKVLNTLGWNYETISTLTELLYEINCKSIRNTDWFGHPINIFNSPNGFVNSDYNIYPDEMLDTIQKIHGEPVEHSIF